MKNGYVILGILVLLFMSMYGYAYLSVFLEKQKQKKQIKLEMEAEERKRLELLKQEEIRMSKIERFKKRKEEIQHELMLLAKRKQEQKTS